MSEGATGKANHPEAQVDEQSCTEGSAAAIA